MEDIGRLVFASIVLMGDRVAKKEFPDFSDLIERVRENFRQNCDRVVKKEFSEFSESVGRARACARGKK